MQVAKLVPGADGVFAVAFSHDRKLLAAGDSSGVVTLYDVAGWQRAGLTLRGNGGAVTGLDFSPDDTSLVAVGGDGSLRLWDVHLRQLVGVLAGSTQAGSTKSSPTAATCSASSPPTPASSGISTPARGKRRPAGSQTAT